MFQQSGNSAEDSGQNVGPGQKKEGPTGVEVDKSDKQAQEEDGKMGLLPERELLETTVAECADHQKRQRKHRCDHPGCRNRVVDRLTEKMNNGGNGPAT